MRTDRCLAIIAAAERLFADQGYANTSIADIAKAAGVSKALIYHHFANKDELLGQITEGVRVPTAEKIRAILRSNETVKAKLRAIIEAFTDAAYSQREAVKILTYEEFSSNDTKTPLFPVAQANRQMFARLVRDGIRTGELRSIDERLGALIIAGIIREAVFQICVGQLTGRPDKIADDLMEPIWRGIGR